MSARLILCLSCALVASASAADWPQWRGPTQNGVAAEGDYPIEWSTEQNVRWKAVLPSRGGSTPAVVGDNIYVTATTDDEQNAVLCFSRTGELKWQREFGTKRPGKHRKASGCNPSPCANSEHVVAYFKSGDLGCFTSGGDLVWEKNLQTDFGEDTLWWDLGTSPVMTDEHVIVTVMHSGPSFLVAYEIESGKQAWKADRNLGAPEEAAQSYTTPIVTQRDGKTVLVVAGADHITCHDATSGAEIWRCGGLNPTQHKYFRSIASPVIENDIVVAPYARGDTLTAVKLDSDGDVTEDSQQLIWTDKGHGTDVPTPCAADGKVYVLSDKGELSCLDVKSGDVHWSERVGKHRSGYSASPILAGDTLYMLREDGTCTVATVSDKGFEVQSENALEESAVATPVLIDGMILIRTFDHLWCIGS